MKTKMKAKMKAKVILIALAFIASLGFESCTQSDASSLLNDAQGKIVLDFPQITTFTTTASDLKQADIDGLLLMREEEKMAQDVYDSFYGTYGVITFDKISTSETHHTEAVLALINHFGLTDPALGSVGKFSNQAIQTLYNQLIAAGTSSNEALSTGAYIEEYDIADLKKLIAETSNTDILAVYNNLLKGSQNHLRAFVRALYSQGITYKAQILSSTDYSSIISGVNTNGNGNRNGNGNGNGNGNRNGRTGSSKN